MEPVWLKGAQARVKNLLRTFRQNEPGKETHSIYFICVTRSPGDDTPEGLYIGMTGKSPKERLKQHLTGYKAAKIFKGPSPKGGVALTQLNAMVPKMSWEDASRFEQLALEAFRGEDKYRTIRRLPRDRVYGH